MIKNKLIVFLVAATTIFLPSSLVVAKVSSLKEAIKQDEIIEAQDFKSLNIQKSSSLTLTFKPLTNKEKKPVYTKIKQLTKKDSIKTMSFENLKELIACQLQVEDYDSALHAIKHAFNTSKDSNERKTLKLTEADVYFTKGSYKKAIENYTEFLDLYPGAKKEAEYALYKNIVAHEFKILKTDQDQTPTHETLKLIDTYLAKGEIYTTYRNEVKEIQHACNNKLYEHEVGIFEFYLNNKKFDAAQGRLATIKEKFVKKLPTIEPDTLQLEYRLASEQGLTERAETVLAQLATRFPAFTKTVSLPEPKNNKRYVLQF